MYILKYKQSRFVQATINTRNNMRGPTPGCLYPWQGEICGCRHHSLQVPCPSNSPFCCGLRIQTNKQQRQQCNFSQIFQIYHLCNRALNATNKPVTNHINSMDGHDLIFPYKVDFLPKQYCKIEFWLNLAKNKNHNLREKQWEKSKFWLLHHTGEYKKKKSQINLCAQNELVLLVYVCINIHVYIMCLCMTTDMCKWSHFRIKFRDFWMIFIFVTLHYVLTLSL